MVRLSRRRFLGAALAGSAVLAGCGSERADEAPAAEVEVLEGLRARELAASAAVIGSPLAELIARQDARHAARLGARDAPPQAAVDRATALARKQEAVFAYVDALPRLADPGLRVAVMQILAAEAGHVAALREEAGDDPAPDAFAGYLEGA